MKQALFEELANYILETERDSYIDYCDENGWKACEIDQNNHVYARALLALELEWEE